MTHYLILGAGHFGGLALQRLAQQDPSAHFTLADQNPAALAACRLPELHAVQLVVEEGIAFLASRLKADPPLDWIIPALPRHVAFEWLRRHTSPGWRWELLSVPVEVENLAVQAFRGKQGEVYLSQADFLCPDDCPEPEDHCYQTGRPRAEALYTLLENLLLPDFVIQVVRSHQLAPGVGGYSPAALQRLWQQAQGSAGQLLVATACRCHGVVHAARRSG